MFLMTQHNIINVDSTDGTDKKKELIFLGVGSFWLVAIDIITNMDVYMCVYVWMYRTHLLIDASPVD